MNSGSRLALVAAIVLTAPATLSIAAGAVHAATGIQGPSLLVEALFAALGVTNTAPLPVRQAWYFGVYILAPAIGAATALFAGTQLRSQARWPLYTVTAAAALSAMFWVVRSLADA